jgi:hypothetical protein
MRQLEGASHTAVTFPASESATWCVGALSHCDLHPTFNIRASAFGPGPPVPAPGPFDRGRSHHETRAEFGLVPCQCERRVEGLKPAQHHKVNSQWVVCRVRMTRTGRLLRINNEAPKKGAVSESSSVSQHTRLSESPQHPLEPR